MLYQDHPLRLATDRIKPESFEASLARIARRLLFSVSDLTSHEYGFLHDLARQEARYPMVAMQKLMTISQRSWRPEDREALPEMVRRRILNGTPTMGMMAAFDFETEANGRTNIEQRKVERRPACPATRTSAIEAFEVQIIASKHCIMAIEAEGIAA